MVPLICIMYGSLAIVWSAPTTANNLVGQDCEGSYIGGTDCISSLAEQLSLHSELTPGSRMKRERGKTTTAMPEDDDLLSDKFRMPTLSSIAKKPPVDIEFEDISYSAGVRGNSGPTLYLLLYFSVLKTTSRHNKRIFVLDHQPISQIFVQNCSCSLFLE